MMRIIAQSRFIYSPVTAVRQIPARDCIQGTSETRGQEDKALRTPDLRCASIMNELRGKRR